MCVSILIVSDYTEVYGTLLESIKHNMNHHNLQNIRLSSCITLMELDTRVELSIFTEI